MSDLLDRPRCTAKSKRSGERCKKPPMHGQTTCAAHGGRAPAARAAARRRLALQAAEADAGRLLASSASVGLEDPFDALATVAAEAVALKDALAARVNALREVRYQASGAGTEQLRAELAMYERSLDRVARIADNMIRLDFEGRKVELEQSRASVVIAAVRGALEVVELSAEDRQRFLDRFLAGIGRAQTGRGTAVRGEVQR